MGATEVVALVVQGAALPCVTMPDDWGAGFCAGTGRRPHPVAAGGWAATLNVTPLLPRKEHPCALYGLHT